MSKQTGWRDDGELRGLFYRADVGFGYLYRLMGTRGSTWLRMFRRGAINSRKVSSGSAERHRIHFSGIEAANELKYTGDTSGLFLPGLTDLDHRAFTAICDEFETCLTQGLFPGPKNEVVLD